MAQYDVQLITKTLVSLRVRAATFDAAREQAQREFMLNPFGRPQRIMEVKVLNTVEVPE